MKRTITLTLCVLWAHALFALTETVDGITWTYTIKNGGASVGDGEYLSSGRAVPKATKGDISIPINLGGYPVTAIANWAFIECGIESVTMPNSVTSIGTEAFRKCRGLTNVIISSGVTSIGRGAFSHCTGLTSVTIPNGVTTIGNYAFSYCVGLTSVTIPNSVTKIEDEVFDECSGLASIVVGDDNDYYMSVNNLLLTKDGRTLICGVNGGDVVIPDGVTTIKDSAFVGCAGLTSVYIPGSVQNVGTYAFCRCEGLTNVVMSYGMTWIGGSYAFAGCKGLNTVTIPASMKYIANYAFSNCSGLRSVLMPNNVSLGDYVFSGCSQCNCINYKPNQTVVLDAQGGIVSPETIIVTYGVAYGELPTPLRDNYVFKGWMLDGNLVSEVSLVSTLDDHFLAAQWKLNEYEVTFNANGGTCSTEMVVVEHGLQIGTLPIAMHEKAEFVGWFDAMRNGKVIDATTVIVDAMTLYAHWRPLRPVVSPDAGVFDNSCQTVSLSCATDGATILYTTDGSDPKVNGREYTKPFAIYKSCTVRTIAVKYDWKDSAEATATFTRGESLSEAANLYGYTMETDSAAPWTVDAAVSHDGVSSVRSGAIGNNGTTYLMASVKKAGTVSFWWKAQCEEPDEEDGEDGYYDYGAFLVDDVVKARIAGNDTGWRFVSVEVPMGGKHVLRWEYRKDGATSYAPDSVWVDQVQWIPADGSGYTLTSPEPVPYSWLRQYNLGVASGDFEAAANAASGKTQGGAATSVWEEFVAGTDPTNALSVFTAKIEMQGATPLITWEPDLNTNGIVRAYKVYGRETLGNGGEWQYPTNSLHRFFKVTVEMP